MFSRLSAGSFRLCVSRDRFRCRYRSRDDAGNHKGYPVCKSRFASGSREMKMASVLLICTLAIAARSSPLCADQAPEKGSGRAPQNAQEGAAATADIAAPKSALVGPTPTSSLALKTVAVMLPKYHLSALAPEFLESA
jgi:hypothetical protein